MILEAVVFFALLLVTTMLLVVLPGTISFVTIIIS